MAIVPDVLIAHTAIISAAWDPWQPPGETDAGDPASHDPAEAPGVARSPGHRRRIALSAAPCGDATPGAHRGTAVRDRHTGSEGDGGTRTVTCWVENHLHRQRKG